MSGNEKVTSGASPEQRGDAELPDPVAEIMRAIGRVRATLENRRQKGWIEDDISDVRDLCARVESLLFARSVSDAPNNHSPSLPASPGTASDAEPSEEQIERAVFAVKHRHTDWRADVVARGYSTDYADSVGEAIEILCTAARASRQQTSKGDGGVAPDVMVRHDAEEADYLTPLSARVAVNDSTGHVDSDGDARQELLRRARDRVAEVGPHFDTCLNADDWNLIRAALSAASEQETR